MAYPNIQQYQEALQYPRTAFSDPSLAAGKIAISGLGTPRVLSGGFALTYAVDVNGKKYAVRCFHQEVKSLEIRYKTISKKLKALNSAYFLDFEYQSQGVRIGGLLFPIVKMTWATGLTLSQFMEAYHSDILRIKNLLNSLNQLAAFLESSGIAHGDIQDLNLIVSNDGKTIQLIDYDGMYLPELSSLGASELGVADYQHPQRNEKNYDSTLDRFSFIVLNLALRALCENPSLWDKSQSGAGIIVFRASDYKNPKSSAIISEIASIPVLAQDAQKFISICVNHFNRIPTLAQFIAGPVISDNEFVDENFEDFGYVSSYPVLDAAKFAVFEQHIGRRVELVGRVVGIKNGYTQNGYPYAFINFGHWTGKIVKIVLWSEALERGGDLPTNKWIGRWVTVRGLVEPAYISPVFHYEHISIAADSMNQIRFLSHQDAQYRLSSSVISPPVRPIAPSVSVPPPVRPIAPSVSVPPVRSVVSPVAQHLSTPRIAGISKNEAIILEMQRANSLSSNNSSLNQLSGTVPLTQSTPKKSEKIPEIQVIATPVVAKKEELPKRELSGSTGFWKWISNFFK